MYGVYIWLLANPAYMQSQNRWPASPQLQSALAVKQKRATKLLIPRISLSIDQVPPFQFKQHTRYHTQKKEDEPEW
jgi:hypothetical protein